MKNLVFCIMMALIAGCTQKPAEESVAMQVDLAKPQEAAVEESAPAPPKTITATVVRKLIKNGRIAFETEDPMAVRKQIIASAKAFNGYISSESEEKQGGETSYQMVVRVPAERFDQLLTSATKGVSEFRERSIEIEDVTEDFLDHEARVRSKKEIESRYRQLLSKALSVKDILEIEKQMGEIRTEIEASEGRLKYLTDQVQYSTLRITFYKSIPSGSSFSHEISNAFSNGWQSLRVLAVILVTIWPFVLLAVLTLFAVRYFRKRARKNTEAVTEADQASR
nr:DUF4349 domain-containing protein [uncultured Dyadobacter sp.]